jgi:glutamate-ammonia-ligase adenylyltransferase
VPEESLTRLSALLEPDDIDVVAHHVAASADPEEAWGRLVPIIEANPGVISDRVQLQRVCALAGSSRALSRSLAQTPQLLDGAPPDASVTSKVRSALVRIAGDDLTGQLDMAQATARFSDAIDGIVTDTLHSARAAIAEKHPMVTRLPFVVVAMGKWGARELNYASDVDLIMVHDSIEGEESGSRSAALALASRLISDLSAPTFDGPALEIDADLRPEGTMGPLSRSLDGYTGYYEQWADAWELQALLKARPAAGDPDLGQRFMKLVERVVWDRGLDVEALRSIRRIKEQAEQAARPRDLKRAQGGIRDIEFAVQLLQLVHGRFDTDLRALATLDALEALTGHGYIDDEEHDRLTRAYRFLRDIEHRIQLWDLRQTHDLPKDEGSLARIGRSLGFEDAEGLLQQLGEVRAEVRHLHERLYFQPILEALVGSPSARLGISQAELRLEALGFHDVIAATRALEELTSGLSRRSRVMGQMLPLMLDWLSLSPDPDLGLAQLRILLAHSSDHSNLITLLQRSPGAGERLCLLLGTGRLLGELIDRIPEFVPRLADEDRLAQVRTREAATERLIGLLDSRPEYEAKIGTIRRFTRRRKLRIAARDVLGEAPVANTIESLSDSADAAIEGAVHIAKGDRGGGFTVIAMGKWGGRELSYGSDLDLMYVFSNRADRDQALAMTAELNRILSEPSRHGDGYQLDASIRPEGRRGAMARSLDSYLKYYDQWAEPWEMLALVKARPVAGDESLAEAYVEAVAPFLWKDRLEPETLRAIRSIKARVESERIPPGEDPDYHLKLGPGGLSDIEFLVQLGQLKHGAADPSLRVTNTLVALAALHRAERLSDREFGTLESSYLFCTRVRMRLHLQTGRAMDSLPTEPADLARLASSLGFDRASDLREQYRRVTRRARQVFKERFYE